MREHISRERLLGVVRADFSLHAGTARDVGCARVKSARTAPSRSRVRTDVPATLFNLLSAPFICPEGTALLLASLRTMLARWNIFPRLFPDPSRPDFGSCGRTRCKYERNPSTFSGEHPAGKKMQQDFTDDEGYLRCEWARLRLAMPRNTQGKQNHTTRPGAPRIVAQPTASGDYTARRGQLPHAACRRG